jgi:metallo-beta-lactamase superfamily protein
LAGSEVGHPPSVDEVEVSFFGPGYGESVLLHLGQQDWVVVDSCLNKAKVPAALAYLRLLGLDPSEVVKLVIATHWHDDHVGGLGAAFRECKNAMFVCSDALRNDEFLTLVTSMKSRSMMISPGVKEFNEVMEVLKERTTGRSRSVSPTWAVANRRVWTHPPGQSTLPAEIHSLSPSDTSITLAKQAIGALIPQAGQSKRRVSSRPPNHVAVVLWVKVGNSSILLGSDLENTREPSCGWTAILDSASRPQDKASIFKIAHHGSSTAYQPRVWSEMLIPQPYATLTPFLRGNISLPGKADAKRICEHTSNSFSTADTKTREIKGRSNIVIKTIRETVRSIKEVPASSGMVRVRKVASAPAEATWTVQLFGTALPLNRLCT